MPSMSSASAACATLFEFRGPMSDQAFASLIYGWYGGLVYFTPLLGGLDRRPLARTPTTVVIGALLMSAGHLAMSFDQSFLIALALLILGSGCLKGNISAQVGTALSARRRSRRDRGFTIFSAAINIGAVLGPLACGAVAAIYGWHAGFGARRGADDPGAGRSTLPASAICPTAAVAAPTRRRCRR